MRKIDSMWSDLPMDRASTPIQKRCSYTGPKTSTPKASISKCSNTHRSRKKKKKKKELNNNNIDYRLLFYGQQSNITKQKKHSFIQIWFL